MSELLHVERLMELEPHVIADHPRDGPEDCSGFAKIEQRLRPDGQRRLAFEEGAPRGDVAQPYRGRCKIIMKDARPN
jgi:hypothetical protein